MHPRYSVILLAAMAAAAQQSSTLTLGGIVVNSQSGEPLKHALVRAVRFDSPQGPGRPAVPFSASTFTDEAGAFHFEGLAAGSYGVSAEKPRFSAGPGSKNVVLTESKSDVQIKLSPLGVITGKVTDRDGQPMRGVNVIALSAQVMQGWRQMRLVRSVSTDDRGIFRLWDLSPGKYYVKAVGRTVGTDDQTIVPKYFGGGQTVDSAAPLELQAGMEAPAHLSLQLVAAYKIRGTVQNLGSRGALRFELWMGDESITPRFSLNRDTSRFEIQDVAPGSYRLRVTQDQLSAEVPVTVSRADLNGIGMSLVPPVDVRGSIHYSNVPEGRAAGVLTDHRGPDAAICSATLRRAGLAVGPIFRPSELRRDEFLLNQVMPGAYRAEVECHGGYPNSVTFGSQDLLSNPLLEIQPGAVPPPIEITATYGGGTIHGKMSLPDYKDDNLQVIIVPQFAGSGGPFPAFAVRQNGEPGGWEFYTPNLAPGSYTVYAFPGAAEVEFRNPEFLKTLRGGTTAQVAGTSESKVTVTEIVR